MEAMTLNGELTQTNADRGLAKYMNEIGRTPLLNLKQEITLAKKIQDGDKAARDLMIRSNLRLVVTIAQDYANLGMPLSDLISEGSIGLTKAVDRFDPNRGAKLGTYAAWWIKQSIKSALSNQAKIIRLPVHLGQKISKVRQLTLAMANELGHEPSDDEVAAEIGISADRLSELRRSSPRPMSLDAPIDLDEPTELGEIIADDEAQTSYEWLRDQDLQDRLKQALEELDGRERKILSQRFGLDGGEPKTLEQVGDTVGVTRERIRQLQARALAKLQRYLTRDIAPATADPTDVDLTIATQAA